MTNEEKEFYKQIGDNVRIVRMANNVSQDQLAENIGLSRPSLTNIETNRQRIKLFDVIKLCNYLNVELSDIIPYKNNSVTEKINNESIK